MRRPIIGVIGSGRHAHDDLSRDVGRLVATFQAHLLTGGGQGVMAACTRAFCEVPDRAGLAIGILPCRQNDPLCRPKDGYPNEWVELAIPTHLPLSGERGTEPLSRNHILVLASDLLVMLPGCAGTCSEARLALRYGKPIVAYLGDACVLPPDLTDLPRASTIADVERFLRKHAPEWTVRG